MIAALIMVQAATLPTPAADEVVVIGRRLRDWRATISLVGDKLSCRVKQSTGDKAIDAIGCSAMTECWPEVQPQFYATRIKGLPADDRKRLMSVADQSYVKCILARRKAGIALLAEQRANESGL